MRSLFTILTLPALVGMLWEGGYGCAAQPDARTVSAPVGNARAIDRLHPEFQQRLAAFLQDAADAGHSLKVISALRPLDRAKARRKGRASWHNFGLAVDLNFKRYKDMNAALRNYRRDRSRWQALGALAESHGLIWGGRWNRKEIFHVEWHPGMPSGLRGTHLKRLLAGNGPRGLYYAHTPHGHGDDHARTRVARADTPRRTRRFKPPPRRLRRR